MEKVEFDDQKVHVTWKDGTSSSYHNIWLRDGDQAETSYHPLTKQRLFSTFDIPENVKAAKAEFDNNNLYVYWAHDLEHKSVYPLEWLKEHSYDNGSKGSIKKNGLLYMKKIVWSPNDIHPDKNNLPSVKYTDVMATDNNDQGVAEWTKKIYQYGFCMIENVPENPQDTEKLVERIAYIRPTHYGGFWDFSADLSKNDTAYTDLYLGSHTDGTYWSDTPGLQLFHLLHHHGKGGETMLVDGLFCAEKFRQREPELFDFLSELPIPAHSAGDENVCITPAIPQPIFKLGLDGEIVQIRWNNDDRSTMTRWKDPDEDIPKFYKAIRIWHKILLENEIVFPLKPGTCLIFDNWRVLHGRQAFTGSRRMCGAYINRDDYMSRFQLLNFGRENVLKTL